MLATLWKVTSWQTIEQWSDTIRILADAGTIVGKRKKGEITCGELQLLSDLEESYNR